MIDRNGDFDGYGTAQLAAAGYYLQLVWAGRTETEALHETSDYAWDGFGAPFVWDGQAPFGWLLDFYTGERVRPALPEELKRYQCGAIQTCRFSWYEEDWYLFEPPETRPVIPDEY